jgi:hypothetical protein
VKGVVLQFERRFRESEYGSARLISVPVAAASRVRLIQSRSIPDSRHSRPASARPGVVAQVTDNGPSSAASAPYFRVGCQPWNRQCERLVRRACAGEGAFR